MGNQADNLAVLRDLMHAANQLNTLIENADRDGQPGPGSDTFTHALKAMIEGWCADYADQLAPSLTMQLHQARRLGETARIDHLRKALEAVPAA